MSIDTALVVWMKRPNSYTGEDVVEISCHGGPVILKKILNSCIDAGARIAEPGEFTKRAFMNGKMDLAQAEAVADLISATSEAAARSACRQLEGELSEKIGAAEDELTELLAFVEASIDFPEEDIEFIKNERIEERLDKLMSKIKSMSDTYVGGKFLKEGVNVAIVGKPNVGKSSLFNALVGKNRAIVHHTSGTTRDLVTETIEIEGIAFHLTDAAGICEGGHAVERIGIEKAREAIRIADLVLFVVDGSQPLDDEDKKIFESLDQKRTVVCINKSDLLKTVPPLYKGRTGGVDLPPLSPPYTEILIQRLMESGAGFRLKDPLEDKGGDLMLSALRGDGIESLKAKMFLEVAGEKRKGVESVVVTSARHKEALDVTVAYLKDALTAAHEKSSAEFVAHHLHMARDCLGRITGKTGTESILDEIFSRFCIGK